MTSIALFGAGGKMGHRLSRNLKDSRFTVRHVEVSEQGRARLAQDFGVQCVSAETALADAQVAILAVPYKAPKKRKDGSISDPGYPGATIARIVPWLTWRALMERAEDQRRALARWQIDSGLLMVKNGPACELPPKPKVRLC